MFNHLDTIPACDSQPPSYPHCHSKYRAMLRVAWVKNMKYKRIKKFNSFKYILTHMRAKYSTDS